MIAIVLSLIIVLSGFESPVLAEDNFFDYCNSQTNYKEYIGDGYTTINSYGNYGTKN